jgi:integrase
MTGLALGVPSWWSASSRRASPRTLYLTPELILLLRRRRAAQAAESRPRSAAAVEAWKDHGLVFPSEIGTPMDPDNFTHRFSTLCKRAGLGHWHPPELRHSGASLMLAHGTELHVVSEALGHTSIAMTKDVCGHPVGGGPAPGCGADVTAAIQYRREPESRWFPTWLPRLIRQRCGHE